MTKEVKTSVVPYSLSNQGFMGEGGKLGPTHHPYTTHDPERGYNISYERTDQPMSSNSKYKKLGTNKSHREMTVGLPHEIFTIFLDKKFSEYLNIV